MTAKTKKAKWRKARPRPGKGWSLHFVTCSCYHRHAGLGRSRVNFQEWALKIKPVSRQRFGEAASAQTPLIRSERE